MSSKKKTSTNQSFNNTQTLNPYSRNMLETGIGNARGMLHDNPFQSYTGERVAGLNDTQNQARQGFTDYIKNGNPLLEQAGEAAQAAGGYRPETIEAQNFGDADLSQYQNPFQQQVIDATTSEMDRAHGINQNNIKGNAARAGAFGGDRHAIVESEANRNHADQRARTVAGLNSQGFQQAAGLFQNDANRQLQADTANNQFGLAGANLGLNSAGLMGQLGQYGQQNALNNAQMMNQFGTQEQDTAQRGLDANYQEANRERDDFFRRLQAEMGITGLTPILTNSSGNSSGTSVTRESNPMGWAGLGLQGGAMMFSDRRLKENIRKIGEKNGHNWYSFTYIGDDTPREGVMAQEVARKLPDAVSWVRGFMAVDYAKLGVA